MDTERPTSTGYPPRLDKRQFEAQLWSLRRRSRMIASEPHDFRYTVFVLRLVWVVVIMPFLTGAACAFLLSH